MDQILAATTQTQVAAGQLPTNAEEASPPEEEHTLTELLAACEGAMCEVLTEDNYLFFAGHVTEQDPEFKMATIEPRHNSEAPLGVGHSTAVKIQVRVHESWGTLVMLYGTVSVCEEDYWRIFVHHAVACNECRRAFRQRVEVEATILWGPGFRFRGKCQLEDISLVGVALYSPLKLDVGRRLVLSIPYLTEEYQYPYELPCTVAACRNVAEHGQPPRWRYGCAFDPLDEDLESILYKDIMMLQFKGRNV